MAITDLCTRALTAVTSDATRIQVPVDAHNEIVAALDEPSHLFAELYTFKYHETVMIYDVVGEGGIGYLVIQRGMEGTEARSWPDGVCLRIVRQVDGRPCGDPAEGTGTSLTDLLRALLAMLQIGDGLELVDGATGPLLRVQATGVMPGAYGGAEVNTRGQFTAIPQGWPASAVPAFELCCEGSTPTPPPAGGVQSVEGIRPDGTGNVRLCVNTTGDVPVTGTTPVFICANGSMARTTVAAILSLVPAVPGVDLSGYVRSVGGLVPNAVGVVNPENAAILNAYSNATVLLSTPAGLRRTTVDALLAGVSDTASLTLTLDPATGTLRVILGAQEQEVKVYPDVALSVTGDTLTLTVGADENTVILPVPQIENALSLNAATGELTSTVNGAEATITVPLLTSVPIANEAPPGTHFKLIRTAAGEFMFVLDN